MESDERESPVQHIKSTDTHHRSHTSNITIQICCMQSDIAERLPEMVTTRSLELGRASPDT